jgi:5,10-methylenetetrahydromethanopterin reductase
MTADRAFGRDGAPHIGISWRTDDLQPAERERLRAMVRVAEQSGVERIAVGDSQWAHFDAAIIATLMAQHATSAWVGISPTNPVTREPSVMASILAGIDSLTSGRGCLVMTSGDTAVYNAGLRPGRLAVIEDYVRCIRDLVRMGRATYQGRRQVVRWWNRAYRPDPTIYIHAEGPKMLHLAGRIGDGVVIGSGLLPEVIEDSLRRVEAGARESGRTLDDLDIWWSARPSVARTAAQAIEEIKGSISSAGNHSMRFGFEGKNVPPDIAPRLKRFVEGYDTTQHQAAEGDNVRRMEEAGLTEYFFARWGVVGDPPAFAGRLRELQSLGVEQLWFAWGAARLHHFELLRDEVLPAL